MGILFSFNWESYKLISSTTITDTDNKVYFMSPEVCMKYNNTKNGTINYIDTKYNGKSEIIVKLDEYFKLKINEVLINDRYCLTEVNTQIMLSKLNAGPMDTRSNPFESYSKNGSKYIIRAIYDQKLNVYKINIELM